MPPADAFRFRALDGDDRAILAAILPAMIPSAGVTATIEGFDTAVAGLTPAVQAEVAQLFAILRIPVLRVLATGLTVPWDRATAQEVARFLTRWRFSPILESSCGLRRAPSTLDGRMVRKRRGVAGHRLSRPSGPAIDDLDAVRRGIESGWRAYDASTFSRDQTYEADVAIVGTGAGGGTAAEILSGAGLRVILVEEGPLWTSSDFHMLERESYPNLYQESAGRKTKDKGINILQGRSVGGSTTVNWTSSFRTPPATLAYWRERFGLADFDESDLAPWFARMEARLNVKPWAKPPNANNDVLRVGAQRLGIPAATIPRNVKGCWNLGYCGLGCPTNAKQSMLVTTIPAALAKGATLLSRARAWSS